MKLARNDRRSGRVRTLVAAPLIAAGLAGSLALVTSSMAAASAIPVTAAEALVTEVTPDVLIDCVQEDGGNSFRLGAEGNGTEGIDYDVDMDRGGYASVTASPLPDNVITLPEGSVWVLNEDGTAFLALYLLIEQRCPDVEDSGRPPVFVDVQPGHRFYTDIRWLADERLAEGTQFGQETFFNPNSPMSRQAMAAFIYRYVEGLIKPWTPVPGTQTFSDVSPEHQFYVQIEWMAAMKLSGGYVDGTYGSTNAVSRQAMAAFLHRMADEPAPAGAPSFDDVTAANTFAGAIAWLEETKIAEGYQDGTFGITRPVSRQAMARFLHRYDQVVAPVPAV